ncbi:unnamed protein product [Ceutorhynchus assimilis]|uniref:Sphingomyelin synthase-like domain-containing protein n=1 Tax=Ceutorhynchus assimilis TaxID=467358 RepID=A0A9P0DGM0_9CUCU|nr:unnamed protein product [Ceutorhynchus assimilis]
MAYYNKSDKKKRNLNINGIKIDDRKFPEKLSLQSLKYIDAEENNNSGSLLGLEETEVDQIDGEMVLEPKFVDYGSIHPTIDSHSHPAHHHGVGSALLPNLDDEDAIPNTSKGTKMTQGDLYQRQPLLPNQLKTSDHWSHNSHSSSSYADEDEEDIMEKGTSRNGDVKIDIPVSREEPRFPQERLKTLLAFIIMCFNFIFTLTSLALVHEKVPDKDAYGPLPDVFLDNVPKYTWALDVSEYIIIFCVNTCMIAMVFHKHRFIVFRRIFLIMSLLYMYRAITMYVTVLPMSNRDYPCSPKSNHTSPRLIAQRVLHLMSGFGLSVNGKHTFCGDFIYSGHTVILVFSYLIISEYTPKKFFLLRIVHWLYWIMAVIGILMLQLSHGHYTVDVIIAYYVTTRIFWTYHTLANNPNLKQFSSNNLLSRSWWFALFLYFESNVGGTIPRQFDWPLPWPRRWQSKGNRAS